MPQVHPVISPSKARNSAALSVVNGENGHSMNHPWQAAAKFPDTLSPGRLTAGPDPIAGTGGAALRRRFPGLSGRHVNRPMLSGLRRLTS